MNEHDEDLEYFRKKLEEILLKDIPRKHWDNREFTKEDKEFEERWNRFVKRYLNDMHP